MRLIESVAWLCALTLAATALAYEWLGVLVSGASGKAHCSPSPRH
ncbi:hypothetical protein EMIT0P43_190071 [Pseudomonas jessenii]